MKRMLRQNGLSLVLLALFLGTWLGGQALVGHADSDEDRRRHGLPPETLGQYLSGSHFIEATSENWEPEFFQMGVYVALTVALFQKGSAESKPLDKPADVDRDPRLSKPSPASPWPVRKGGFLLLIYERSLTLAFLALFLVCFIVHLFSGCANFNEELQMEGQQTLSVSQYFRSSHFWFESLQNWQSEFLAILSMVVLSIFLRQRGSPESKPVDALHSETGS